MLGLRGVVYLALAAFGGTFAAAWARQMASARRRAVADGNAEDASRVGWPGGQHVAIGFLTNFFDMLGIGSFATTTAAFRFLQLVPDRLLPGTLLVGHTFATLTEAFVSIAIIEVEMPTLILLVAASVLGSWLGAGLVAGLPQRKIQIGMGTALLAAALVMLAGMVKLIPAGGDALGLSGARLGAGMVGFAVIGALMTIGIGNFAPSLILLGFLGMNTKSIFPIMMASGAFLMPVGSIQFVRRGSYHVRAALGLALGGIPGVLLAAYVVQSLPLDWLRWLVLVVVVYTAGSMLQTAARSAPAAASPEARS